MSRQDYEERRKARIDGLHRKAERLELESAQSFKRADGLLAPIPFGQPILVGHHSERRHRNTLKKADNAMRRGCEQSTEAKRTRMRAIAAEENHTISSDDPDAILRLESKIASLEANRRQMKAINAAWRKAGRPAHDDQEGWRKIADAPQVQMNMNDLSRVRHGMRLDPLDRGPFPSYALQNIGANIRRLKQRIEALQREETKPAAEPVQGDGYTIEERPDLNRVTVTFDEKPPRETCKELRSRGWRWSPREGAWMRHLNNAGRYAAQALQEVL